MQRLPLSTWPQITNPAKLMWIPPQTRKRRHQILLAVSGCIREANCANSRKMKTCHLQRYGWLPSVKIPFSSASGPVYKAANSCDGGPANSLTPLERVMLGCKIPKRTDSTLTPLNTFPESHCKLSTRAGTRTQRQMPTPATQSRDPETQEKKRPTETHRQPTCNKMPRHW